MEAPLVPVINIIKNSMDVEKIFLLGNYPLQPADLGEEYDLLVLVKDTHNRPNDEFESLIHNRSIDTVPVNASVFKLSKVNEMILNGNYFFSAFCVPEKLIYDAGRIRLESPPAKHDLPGFKVLKQIHEGMMEKANGFVAGAINFYQSNDFSLSGFMLHQAAEHGLNSLLQPLMQFRLHTHNLHKLMRITRRFSIEVFNLFPRDTDTEIRLFQLLQKAYIHARYKDNFEVKEEDAAVLLERTKLLLQKVGEEFERILHSIKVPSDEIKT
jgi:HEPN domain-containing protein